VSPSEGGSKLFSAAFAQSRNAMALVDGARRHVDANGAYVALLGYPRSAIIGQPTYRFVVGGPQATVTEWERMVAQGRFTGTTELEGADGTHVGVQWAATTEVITGRNLVLFVALSTSRWGGRFRRTVAEGGETGTLTAREREIVRLVALGRTGPEIADDLVIAHDTVRTHVRNAMDKLGARSRAHLVAKAIGAGHVVE
jgi:DNA-binding CsgD family transcriptional regulator